MRILTERLARLYKIRLATRPIPIDKPALMALAKDIMAELPKHLRFQDGPETPLYYQRGFNPNTWGFTIQVYYTTDVMGRVVQVPVKVNAKHKVFDFRDPRQYVAGGYVRATGFKGKDLDKYLMGVTLSSSRSPQDFLSNKSQVEREIYSVLIHEVTHLRDRFVGRADTQSTDEVEAKTYYNRPTEVRAFMQQIVDEVVDYVDSLGRKGRLWAGPSMYNLEGGLEASPTWDRIRKMLTPQTKKILLKGVHTGYQDALPELLERYPPDQE